MTKSILVIDTPPNCIDCPIATTIKDKVSNKWVAHCDPCGKFNEQTIERPEWCPLQGMPHELEHDGGMSRTADIYHEGYVDGWNYLLSLLEEEDE